MQFGRAHDKAGPAPYVSIVVTGRNDGYGGDFNGRFLRALEFNARELAARNVSWEFVLVEWAAPMGSPLLAELAVEAVPSVAGRIRAFVVDAQYQQALTLNTRLVYLEFIAKNVGIRRARGAFILTTNADVYLGRHVLDCFRRCDLERRVIYRARRIDLKLGIDHSCFDWAVLEDQRNHESGFNPLRPPLYPGGTGDFVLLDAETFMHLRGFNEIYRVAKIGIDLNFLVKAFHSDVAIRDIGGPVYHLNHVGSFRLTKALYLERQAEAPYGDPRWPSSFAVYDNPEDWGLAAAPTTAESETISRLAFDWSAVPPMVDLDRIVCKSLAGNAGEPA